ncbi:DUF559 domain-containing protein [Pseudomonas sp. MAFF212428]|uniref:DUF559 domain-containing protein n=1 Tax=Pseudomonas brassicae TaxID=2708063 RepID=A0A6M0CVF5_9PSED|nr:DUF559 domain-containing protein [Pseudomonas brassicae]
MNQDEWLSRNAAQFGSEFERLFALQVLSLVAEIRYESLSLQFPFKDVDGKQRYCDFVISEEGGVRIAIEIDGYDKRGDGTGMSHDDFIDWQRRQAALTSQGWRVLRFANRDVRDEPARCAGHIRALLEEERKKAHSLLSHTRQHAGAQQLAAVQGSQIKGLNKEVSVMKYTIMSFTALIAVLIVVFAFKGNESSAGPVLASSAVAAPAAPAALQGATCDNPLDWREAARHVGQSAAVVGPIIKVTYKQPPRASRPGSTSVLASRARNGWGWWCGASIAQHSRRCCRSRWRGAMCA